VVPGRVYIQYLADDLLPLPDVVANVLDPSAGHLRDVNQALLAGILVQRDKGSEVHYLSHGADD
jgi:hypothetical protein